jgi:hypothetical protein
MRLTFILLFFSLIECKQQPAVTDGPFAFGLSQGKVDDRISEASGLVSSEMNPGMLWTLNDSGNPAEVFLIDQAAQTKMVCTLKGIKNRDWEEIAIGAGPKKDKTYIYVGDIGDNLSQYPTKIIYRFEEPLFDGIAKEITNFETFTIKLSDGIRDTEAMMIDPATNNLFLVSKREDSVRLYQVDFPFTKKELVANKVATLDLTLIVAADISRDGQEVLMKNYNLVYYWKRQPDQSLIELLQQKPTKLPYDPEPQGESICFAHDHKGYYTLSESSSKKKPHLYWYQRK